MRNGDKGMKIFGVFVFLMFVGSIFSGVVAATTYDPQAAVNYADTWWNGRNPNYHDYSSEGGDCANFASQCLIAGGLDLSAHPGADSWGCIPSCTNLHDYLVNYLGTTYETRPKSQVEPIWFVPGDPAIFPTPKHAVFAVTGDATHYATCNAHSTDRNHKTIQWFFDNSNWNSCTYYHIPTDIPTPPAPPTITSPGSSSGPGPTIDTLTPTLQWNSVSNSNADKYLYDMGIATGQSVGYYEPYQTQLDSELHNIKAPNQPPTAIIDSITPDPAEQGTDTVSFSFTGHGTDPDGTVVAYNWNSSIDGQLSTSAAFTKPASELSVGTHTIYFKVQDNDGAWSTEDTEDLTINPANVPPTAIIDSITTDPAEQGTDTVSFSGHGTDTDGTVVAYNWSSSIDGPLSSSASFTKPASVLSVGTHTIYFKVQDDDGAWSTEDTADLTIYPANVPPTAIIDSITPDPAEQGTDTVSFSGHGTDTDGTVVAYNWSSSIDGPLSSSASFTKPASVLSVGTHTIYFKVQDDDGAWSTEDTADLTINPANVAPTAIIDSITPDSAEQGTDTVSFSGHGTDTDGTVVAYNWSSSIDGPLSTSAAFTKPASELSVGTHTIYFKVQDNDGAWSTEDTADLTINPANVAPTAIIDSITTDPAEQGTDTVSVSFSGHGTDPDGTVVAYNWSSSIDGLLSTSAAFTKPASELSVGTHTIYFKVQDDDGTWSTEDTEDLTIYPGPELSYSPESHDFCDMRECETDNTTFAIWNSGTDTLTYSLSETCDWLEVHPTSGSSTGEHNSITVDVDTTGLFEGSHTCDITINSNDGSGTFTVTVNVVQYPESSWTFMVYLDGDNNLEGAAIDDFMEMSAVGSTSDVNIVVQFDRIPGGVSSYGDWTDCKRFHVTYGMTPTAANALLIDLGECNMGDPNTLRDFVTWTMTEFPADNYALILWNHGDGWKSINKWVPWADDIKDAKDAGLTRGICWDNTNNDYLSLQETEQALTGKYVQLLGYDACLMHMIEVVYQVISNAGVSVGSEEVEPWDGWPYDTILADLTVTPTMNEDALGTVIVDRYMDSYGYTGSKTQSAMDNSALPNLVGAVDNLAQALMTEINAGHVADVQEARNAAEEIHYNYYIDLYHFAEMVDIYVPGAAAQAQAVMNEVSKMYEAHGTSVPNDHGLSIYFPEAEWAYLSSYENTKFAVDTHWDEFLKEYYAPTICGNMGVNPTSWSPTVNCSETDNEIVTVSATGGLVKGVTVSKISGPTWLSVSPTDLGDIASGSSKTFMMTASPTASLSAGTRGDFAYTVRVSNTCESPSTIDVSGAIHVDCIEPSQPPSYSNPSVSPSSGTPSTQFDYSVDVKDPDGDTVTVTLKTYDPSDGSWEDQGNRNVVGSGTASWNDLTPFEVDDKGQTAKYTFVFDEGYNSGEWGPFYGPAIETDAGFSNWDYPSTSLAAEKIPVEVDISNPHGVKSAWLHYDYGDDGSEDGSTQMSLISVRGAKTEIQGGSSSGLGVKAQKIAVSESAPLSGGGGSGVAEREGIQKSIYLYDAKTCKDVEDSDPYDPIGVTTVFSPTDTISLTWLQFNDIWSSHTVKWEWYDPNGNFYEDCTYLIPDPSDLGYDYHEWYKCWCGIYITGYSAAEEEGIWTVKVYLDGGQIETLYFNIEYVISDYTMCKDVQASSPYDPIERTSTFLADDEMAVSWLRLDDVTNSLNVKWEWYDPSGTLYGTWDTDTSEPEEGCYLDWVKAYCSLYIRDHAAAGKPGEWVVKVYIDDEYKFAEEFTIYPNDARYKCEIPAPRMDYAGDEVSFYVSAYDIHDSPTDSAKHLLVIYVPDDPTLSIFPSSHDFGDKREGETDSTTFDVWNSGTGTLTYALSESCGWVEVNPTGGSSTGEHDTITVDIDTTGLSEGSHTCDISINSNDGTGTFTVTVNVVPCPESSWTFMVYLDGDNNLEGAAIDDFMEMSFVGSTSDVNIVVQFDRIPGHDTSYGDWTDCKRFHVTSGMTPMPANATEDLGECNMGDPNTLAAFVTWAMTEYPANNYALILWNHGSGWKKWKWNDPDPDIGRGVCWDDTSGGDYLTLRETEQALTGKYVNLLGYDACLMHMMAVVYQVMANAGVSVGSEEVEPWDGWPYDTILSALTVTPTMNEDALATVIVDRYMVSYGYTGSETQSAMDNSALPNLGTAVDNLAQALITEINGGHWAQVQQARNVAAEMDWDNDYIDLYHFAEMVDTYVPGATAQAQAVMNEVSKMYEAHGTSVPNDHGLSIYYPRYGGGYLASYGGTAFARDTQWNEFLVKYLYPGGAGLDDIAYVHNGAWYVSTNGDNIPEYSFWFGFPGDKAVVGDINQDGTDDIARFKDGAWYVSTNGDNIPEYSFWFGFPGDMPVVGDINQDGTDDIAYVHNGAWYVSTNGDNIPEYSFWFGFPGDMPVVGDINQDGTDDIAYVHNGAWYVSTNGDNIPEYSFWFGFPGDMPVVGDINQDGTDDIAYVHNGAWYISTNGDNIPEYSFWFGFAGDIPVVGNIG